MFRTSPIALNNFWVGSQISYLKGYYFVEPKMTCFKNIYLSSLSFYPAWTLHTFWETVGPGLIKQGAQILIFGQGPKYWGLIRSEPEGIFFYLAFLHKGSYNQILRTFYLMQLFDLRPTWGLGSQKNQGTLTILEFWHKIDSP